MKQNFIEIKPPLPTPETWQQYLKQAVHILKNMEKENNIFLKQLSNLPQKCSKK